MSGMPDQAIGLPGRMASPGAATTTSGSGPLVARATQSRLHLVTFMNRLDQHFAYLQVSAEAHGLHPMVLGYGRPAWWPDGLGAKINALREYVYGHVEDQDVLVFADAFDVLVMGNKDEILGRFESLELRSNRSLVFNAEQYCYPRISGVCDEQSYPPAPYRWRFLNSGVIVGRGFALKSMLRDPVADVIRGSDQFWYQDYFRSHQSTILLDTTCVLMCAVTGADERSGVGWTTAENRSRIMIPDSGSRPSLVHFVSLAHWPTWKKVADGWEATSGLHEAFRQLHPQPARDLLDTWRAEVHLGTTHTMGFVSEKFWTIMRVALCVECNVLGTGQHECENFPSLFGEGCVLAAALVVALVMLVLLCLSVPVRRRCCPPDTSSEHLDPSPLLATIAAWAGPALRVVRRITGSRVGRRLKHPEQVV